MRPKQVLVRTSEEEKTAFKDAADVAGLSLSAWIRVCLRKAAVAELKVVGRSPDFLNQDKD